MNNQNKLSRREAIKILGTATGASLLANIPAKWSKPEVKGSALPAHAQTSCSGNAVEYSITAPAGVTLFYGEILNNVVGTSGTFSDGTILGGNITCGTGCFQLTFLVVGVTNENVALELNTFFGGATTVNFSSSFHMLINLDTGENSSDINTPVNGCDWFFFQ